VTVSKTVLWLVIGAAAFVVVVLAVLTPTVIANDNDGEVRSVRVVAPAPGGLTPAPFPYQRERFPDFRRCLQRHGLGGPGRATPPSPEELYRALKDCGAPFFG
jgi:hypothetical protein